MQVRLVKAGSKAEPKPEPQASFGAQVAAMAEKLQPVAKANPYDTWNDLFKGKVN